MGFGKQGTGVIIRNTTADALGALTQNDVVKLDAITMGEDFRMLKSQIFSSISGLTAGEGIGLLFGVCNGELSVAEIAECLTTDGPTDRNDRVLEEQANRFVQLLGRYLPSGHQTSPTELILFGEGGQPFVEHKPRWTFSNPEGWDYFVINMSTAITTGATAVMMNRHYGVWVT